jgi:hypothetical protein
VFAGNAPGKSPCPLAGKLLDEKDFADLIAARANRSCNALVTAGCVYGHLQANTIITMAAMTMSGAPIITHQRHYCPVVGRAPSKSNDTKRGERMGASYFAAHLGARFHLDKAH